MQSIEKQLLLATALIAFATPAMSLVARQELDWRQLELVRTRETCRDTDNGLLDEYGDGCHYYAVAGGCGETDGNSGFNSR